MKLLLVAKKDEEKVGEEKNVSNNETNQKHISRNE